MSRTKIIPDYEEALRRQVTNSIEEQMRKQGVGVNKLARLINLAPHVVKDMIPMEDSAMRLVTIAHIAEVLDCDVVLEFRRRG